MAFVFLGLRINEQTVRDNRFLVFSMITMCVGSRAAGVWANRRQVQKEVLPPKHYLEALLKELDAL
jgi:hypothetical protein